MEISLGVLCRLCAEENSHLRPLDSVKISALFPHIMSEETQLSAVSCLTCSSKVDDYFEFHEAVMAADVKLKNFITAVKELQIPEDGESQLKGLPEPVSVLANTATQARKRSSSIECPHCRTVRNQADIAKDCRASLIVLSLKHGKNSKNALRNHVRLEHPNEARGRRYGCRVCSLDFTTVDERQQHEVTHVGEKPFLCDQCGKTFEHAANLRIHRATHSAVRNKFPCDVCQKSFLTRKFLQEHKNVHTGLRPYVCSKCGKQFQGKGHLRQHKWTHAGRPFHCEYCGRSFTRKSNMAVHVREIHMKKEKFCDTKEGKESQTEVVPQMLELGETRDAVVQGSASSVLRYAEAPHKEDGPPLFRCRRCKKTFEDASSLKQHHAVHVDITDCGICGKTFKHHGSLTYHRRVAHTGERPFKCSHCDLRFALRSVLTTHERRAHTGYAPFACTYEQCSRTFHDAGALRTHKLTHSDLRPFTCEMCGQGFRRKHSLMVHLKAHTGDRPYKCGTCELSFLQKANLQRHEKRHEAGGRPFFCKFCGESFCKRSDTAKHALCRRKILDNTEITDLQSAENVLDLVTRCHLLETQ